MARGFTFRLEVVRRIRQRLQDEQRRVVAEAARRVRAVEERIERAGEALRHEVEALRGAQVAKRLDMASLRGHRFYMSRLHREIREAEILLAAKQEKLAGERAELAEVSKRLKVIEKLKERQWQRYLQRINRAERAMEDETALQQFMRRRAVRAPGV